MVFMVRDHETKAMVFTHKWSYTWQNFGRDKPPKSPVNDNGPVGIYAASGLDLVGTATTDIDFRKPR